jgi:hypothetical protein
MTMAFGQKIPCRDFSTPQFNAAVQNQKSDASPPSRKAIILDWRGGFE